MRGGGFDKMARLNPPSSRRSPDSGKSKEKKPRLGEHALREAHARGTRSEELWRSVFENSVIGVALTDLNGRFIATNPAYQRMLGYTDEELQQHRFLDVTDEKYRELNWALIEELLQGKRRQFQMEKQYRRKDGSLVWVRNSVSIVPGTKGVPRCIMALSEDITEHKRAEESLQAGDVKLRRVIDAIPALVWCNLPDGPNEFLNKRWHEYTGLSPEESWGWGWQVAFHPDDLPPLIKRWQQLLASGEPGEIEARIRGRHGVYRWFLIRVEPFRDESGRIVRWYGTSTDIDDLKRAAQHLRRGEAFLADGQRLSKTGTFSWSIETNEIGWTQELYAIFDFNPTLPVTLELIGSRVHPEDRPMLEDMIARARRAEDRFEYEHRIVMPDASIKYIHLIGHATHNAEGRLEYLGAVQDVTQRRMAEEQLRERERNLSLVVDSIPGLVVRMSAAGEVELANRQLLAYFGKNLEDMRNWMTSGVVHPEDLPRAIETASDSFATGKPYEMEIRVRRFDGVYRWFQARGIPLRDAEGQILHWYALHTDIDDLKKAEEALRQAQGDLARINRVTTMGELAASLAHEITQPISGAMTNANTCLRKLEGDKPDLDEVRLVVARFARDVRRAAEIVGRLRSQFQRGAQHREVIDVNEINRETIALLRDEATRYHISVRTELTADLPRILRDRVQLQQVAMNLIVNGIEAMKDADGIREIVIKSQRGENEWVLVSVCDSGAGFPPQLAEQIFDPFFTTKPKGTGMGLRISRSIIESHGGRLWAVGTPGRGATFHLSLPAAPRNISQ
jgi:PAS domain S-box-containing protein